MYKVCVNTPDWITCPSCGCEAYWDGSVYFCDQCGRSGDSEIISYKKVC